MRGWSLVSREYNTGTDLPSQLLASENLILYTNIPQDILTSPNKRYVLRWSGGTVNTLSVVDSKMLAGGSNVTYLKSNFIPTGSGQISMNDKFFKITITESDVYAWVEPWGSNMVVGAPYLVLDDSGRLLVQADKYNIYWSSAKNYLQSDNPRQVHQTWYRYDARFPKPARFREWWEAPLYYYFNSSSYKGWALPKGGRVLTKTVAQANGNKVEVITARTPGSKDSPIAYHIAVTGELECVMYDYMYELSKNYTAWSYGLVWRLKELLTQYRPTDPNLNILKSIDIQYFGLNDKGEMYVSSSASATPATTYIIATDSRAAHIGPDTTGDLVMWDGDMKPIWSLFADCIQRKNDAWSENNANCIGTEEEGECTLSADRKTASKKVTYKILTPKKGNGTCPYTDKQVIRSVDCTASLKKDCKVTYGAYGSCNNTTGKQTSTFTVTEYPLFGGKACPTTGRTRDCTPVVVYNDPPNGYSICKVSGAKSSSAYSILDNTTPNECKQICSDDISCKAYETRVTSTGTSCRLYNGKETATAGGSGDTGKKCYTLKSRTYIPPATPPASSPPPASSTPRASEAGTLAGEAGTLAAPSPSPSPESSPSPASLSPSPVSSSPSPAPSPSPALPPPPGSPAPSPSPKSSKGLSKGAIIGISVGAVVAVLFLIFIFASSSKKPSSSPQPQMV